MLEADLAGAVADWELLLTEESSLLPRDLDGVDPELEPEDPRLGAALLPLLDPRLGAVLLPLLEPRLGAVLLPLLEPLD